MNDGTVRRDDLTGALAVGLGAFALLLPGAFFGLPTGKFVVGANVILDGGVPYRDFWTMYAPGSFYLTAGLFALFGREVLVQAIAVILLRAAATGVFFLLLRRLGTGRGLALPLCAVFAGMLWERAPELRTYAPALLLLLLATHRMLAYFRTGRGLVGAGLLCGGAALFKHDVGAYGAMAGIIALFLTWIAAGERRPPFWIPPLAASLRLGIAAFAPLVPVAIFLSLAAGPPAAEQLFVFPATRFAPVFGEPYPPIAPDFLPAVFAWLRDPGNLPLGRDAGQATAKWLFAYPPAVAFVAGVAVVLLRRKWIAPESLGAAVLFLSFLPFFWGAAHVQQNTHIRSMAAFTMLLLALAWSAVGERRAEGAGGIAAGASAVRALLAAAMLLYAGGLLVPPAMSAFLVARGARSCRTLDLPGAAGVRVFAGDWAVYHRIGHAVRRHVPEGEPIYVGVARHDAVVVSNPRFYYLTRRPGCVRYRELHPGVVDSPAVQREIIVALEEHGVRCVVLWKFG